MTHRFDNKIFKGNAASNTQKPATKSTAVPIAESVKSCFSNKQNNLQNKQTKTKMILQPTPKTTMIKDKISERKIQMKISSTQYIHLLS